jgi:hypothetical protein
VRARDVILELAERLSNFLVERRLASFLVTRALILVMADAIRQVLPVESDSTVLTWIAVALMVQGAVSSVLVARQTAVRIGMLAAWALGVTPSMYGFVAVLSGSPVVLMWSGVVLSLVLLAELALVEAPRAKRDGADRS